MTIKYGILPVTPFQQNCSILVCEETSTAVVTDPGGEVERIIKTLDQLGVRLEKIILTHAHLDHCSGADQLRRHFNVPIEGPHRDDEFLLDELPKSTSTYGFPVVDSFRPDRWLEQGDTVEFGAQQLQVLHCPGHTPGHVVFFHAGRKLAMVGDVLFQGSIGRTDFPRGDHATLIRSIRERLWPLGDDVSFIPGHGPMSTFGDERAHNPFVGDHIA